MVKQQLLEQKRVLLGALARLGPNGENWIQGITSDGKGNYCALGAIHKELFPHMGVERPFTTTYEEAALTLVRGVYPQEEDWTRVARYNDVRGRSFKEVKKMFCGAITRLDKEMEKEGDA